MKGLKLRKIERLNSAVTFIGFGALEIGRAWGMGADTTVPDEAEACKVLNFALDSNINLIDTASAYHLSEERIGKFLKHRRKEYILASKCGEHNSSAGTFYDFSYGAVKKSIDTSLKLLKTDVIDIMQIHFGPDPKDVLDKGETIGAMKDAVKEGKVRFLGASIDGALAERCIKSGDFDVMQMGYNMFYRDNESNIQLASERGIGVFIRSGLGNGLFTQRVVGSMDALNGRDRMRINKILEIIGNDPKKLTALALRFLYDNEGVSSVLLGTKRTGHIEENFRLLEMNFDLKLLSAVDNACIAE